MGHNAPMNEDQIKAHLSRMSRRGDPRAKAALGAVATPDPGALKPHKFGAVSGYSGDIRFDSQSERRHYERLKDLKAAGHVMMIMRQVPFHFEPDHRLQYRLDFMVFWSCGAITFDDPKGATTPKFTANMQRMLREYPHVCVEVISARGERRPALSEMAPMRQIPEFYRDSPLIQNHERPASGHPDKRQKTSR